MLRLSSASPRCLLLLRCKPMSGNGWIKLHRKLLDSLVFGNEKALKIWVWCLLRANHAPARVLIGRQVINLKAGQFLMGSNKESEFLGIAKTTFWRWLEFLEKEGQVELKKTTKYTIVTIPKWEEYQEERNSNGTQTLPQVGTNKNDKNDKNVAVAIAPASIEMVEDREESERPKKKETYPGARKSFKWFPEQDPAWGINSTELKAGVLLFEKGEEKVRKNIEYCLPRLSDESFPIHRLTPYLLITNWERIYEYSKRG